MKLADFLIIALVAGLFVLAFFIYRKKPCSCSSCSGCCNCKNCKSKDKQSK